MIIWELLLSGGSKMANTMPMADNNTRPMDSEDSNRIPLKKDTDFEGQKDKYKIFASDPASRIGSGGESLVYKAIRESNGEMVVAKIYDQFASIPLNVRSRNRIIKFLSEHSEYKNTHIMPLLDYGNISIEYEDGDVYTKPFDIIPYCPDGELTQCNYEMLRDKVIPEILCALNLLHTSHLVHRDIKPQNIYLLNGEIVVADFGTSGEISSNNQLDYLGTQRKRGTVGYTAPEVWQGYAVAASDYYSFGCTIATLYKGEHVYNNLINQKDEARLKRSMDLKGLPLECPETEADLQVLVNALIMTSETMRAGHDDVAQWINDSQGFIRNWKHRKLHGDEAQPLEFNFDEKIYNTEEELTNAMLDKWEAAKRYLYKGIISGFYKQRNPALADKAIDIVETNKDTTHNQDLGLAMFLHYLNTISTGTVNKPKCPIFWNGKAYEKLSDIAKSISSKTADEKSIIAILKDKFLSWKFNLSSEDSGSNTIKAIKEAENLAADFPLLGYYTFMFHFDPDAEKISSTIDGIFREITGDGNGWHKKAEKFVNDDVMLANLIHLGCTNDVITLKKGYTGTFISDNSTSDLLLFYRLFESICTDKTNIRRHFLTYGPQAYLFWFRENIGLYSFNTEKAKNIERNIKNLKIDSNISINEIQSAFISLRQFMKDFLQLFQNNYLLTYLGLSPKNSSPEITTNNTHAFFAGNFYGINVPVGYLKAIGIQKGEIS